MPEATTGEGNSLLDQLQHLAHSYGGTFTGPAWRVSFMDAYQTRSAGSSGKRAARLIRDTVIAFEALPAANSFVRGADHVLVAYFKAQAERKIELHIGDKSMIIAGPYNRADVERWLDRLEDPTSP